ncbi:MAG: DUF554 domain-containing protein [Clostridia bacterium]|nr:DUF554 domain-containing protein [Clostridia bacterium]
MLGVLVNTATVIIGSAIGLLFKKGISKKINDAVMIAIGACTLFIGISGSLNGQNVLITIISMVLGAIVGTVIDIDKQINSLGDFLKKKFSKTCGTFTEGFVTGCLIFCVGAMTITGSIDSGITGDNSTIFAKSLLDLISSMMLSSALGIGVMFASIFVFVFQGALVLLAQYIAPFLGEAVINELTCVGSIIIILLGLNIIGIGKFKVANFLPAIVFAPFVYYLYQFIISLI